MKIAVITNLCTHYRYKLFKLLSEHHHFDFYLFDEIEKTKEDIKHLSVSKSEGKIFSLPQNRILRRIYKRKYDVIIKCTNNKWLFLWSFLISKIIGAKFIVWHSIWYYPKTFQYKAFSWLLIRILKKHSDAIVVYGEHGKRFLIENGVNPDKIFIGWQTVDNEVYGKDFTDDEIKLIRNKFSIPDTKKVILYVGRLVQLKGIEYLLKALNNLDKHQFVFLAIGDGEMKKKIEEFCTQNNIDFRLPGIIRYNDLPIFYRLAHVMILPSITTKTFKEPWGLVVNEAFNQGCPVVVTDAVGAGSGGLVQHGFNSYVVPEKNERAISDILHRIISDDTLRSTLSSNAKTEIQKWTYDRQAQGFLDAVNYSISPS